jgi:hypothetical protein
MVPCAPGRDSKDMSFVPTTSAPAPSCDGLHHAGVLRPVDTAAAADLGRDSRRDHPQLRIGAPAISIADQLVAICGRLSR